MVLPFLKLFGLPGCATKPVLQQCCFLDICLDCWVAYDQKDKSLVDSLALGTWLTFANLLLLGFYNLYWFWQERRVYYEIMGNTHLPIFGNETINERTERKTRARTQKQVFAYPWFRLILVGYIIITAFFGVFRFEWQLGKPLLVGAAGHNLFEWAMVSFAYYQTPKGRYKSFIIEMTFIWFIMCCIVMIPTFPYFALAEQLTGIVLDYLLPITWWNLAKQNWDDTPYRNLFLTGFVAHFVHLFGTIIPLVIENLIVGQSYYFSATMEFAVFMTVGLTMVLYTAFTPQYQQMVMAKYNFPKNLVAPKFWFWTGVSFVLGLFTTTIFPAMMGICDQTQTKAAVEAK